MIQLSFQPAFDPFNAVFRFLRLRETVFTTGTLHRDHCRILDFYLLFPFRIDEIRLIPGHRKYKKLSKTYEHLKPYGDQPSGQMLFSRMELFQIAALDTLNANNFIQSNAWINRQVDITSTQPAAALTQHLKKANAEQSDLMNFLKILASEYPLSGPNGLKSRTNLLEYKHDSI